jgi:hypothetical protein
MLQRLLIWLIDRLFVHAYAKTLDQYENAAIRRGYMSGQLAERDVWTTAQAAKETKIEAIKLEFLEKGIERGRASMRTGCIFDLYLQRADPATNDDGYLRAAQISMGVPMPAPGVASWAWWAIINETGHEVCLGRLERMTLEQALARYLELLPDAVRSDLGDTQYLTARETAKRKQKEDLPNG